MHIVSPINEMDNWDENPADPVVLKNVISKSKWEGEDAEEDVRDSWDQDPEEEKSDEEIKPLPPPSTKKNWKKVGEKFEEKEKKKQQELEKQNKPLTTEELLAEKIRQQKLQEESDRILAKEIFGSTGLETKEDFDKLKNEIINVISESSKNSNYVVFAEQIIQSLCVHLSSIDLKKISTLVSNLHIEKSKLEKGEKKKSKGKGKAKLKLEGDNDYSEYSAFTEDFDDLI